jgi:hypothetical protein
MGLLEEAYELITKIPMEASIAAWGAFLMLVEGMGMLREQSFLCL